MQKLTRLATCTQSRLSHKHKLKTLTYTPSALLPKRSCLKQASRDKKNGAVPPAPRLASFHLKVSLLGGFSYKWTRDRASGLTTTFFLSLSIFSLPLFTRPVEEVNRAYTIVVLVCKFYFVADVAVAAVAVIAVAAAAVVVVIAVAVVAAVAAVDVCSCC